MLKLFTIKANTNLKFVRFVYVENTIKYQWKDFTSSVLNNFIEPL